jgi:hypothetical protein
VVQLGEYTTEYASRQQAARASIIRVSKYFLGTCQGWRVDLKSLLQLGVDSQPRVVYYTNRLINHEV